MSRDHPSARAARLDIDLAAVAANWRALDALSSAETGAAVKADGYGLGVGPVATALHGAGCRTFFVATLNEAMALDAALGALPATLYVLNGFSPDERPSAIAPERLRPVLSTLAEAEAWAVASPGAPVALQVETGMNRLGVDAADWPALAALGDRLSAALIMSHLACADEPANPMNASQRVQFMAAREALAPAFPTARFSLAATGGVLLGPDFAFDLVRPGVGLYGGQPFAAAKPVVTLSAPALRVWDVPAGAPSGYGGTWIAERPSRLATIPLGYADGVSRALSGRGQARIGSGVAPFAGRVSMDLIVLDVTKCGDVSVGDRATLLDADLTVDQMAETVGTIGYEILTKLGYRAERVYKRTGETS